LSKLRGNKLNCLACGVTFKEGTFMRYAIFSDLHDNHTGLAAVLADAEQWQVDGFVYLGDVGRDPKLFLALQERQIACTFGNWEVSGWQRLPDAIAAWVGDWPATPDMPAAVTKTAAASTYMAGGVGWHTLFPRLHRQEEARWAALAMLESTALRIAFHGHTHVQEVHVWESDETGHRRLRAFRTTGEFTIERGDPAAPNRYLVGVGSAGAPDDGPGLCYALYDDVARQVLLRRL
jgi:predicted phosphodiesterase